MKVGRAAGRRGVDSHGIRYTRRPRRPGHEDIAFWRAAPLRRSKNSYAGFRTWDDIMKRYLIFGLLGPFIGGFLTLIATTYASGYWAQTNLGEVKALFVVFAKSLQYSYLFGIVPALMMAALDEILLHVRRINWVVRMLLVGVVAFAAAELFYGSRGSDAGAIQFILYGWIGLVPMMLSSVLAHRYVEPQAVAASSAG
jgi:hypothetical protein